ncbi:alpha/beta hydrolase [Nocardioidaceae bacterium]|nr:alpha/beta hydrolase [Nocardioidaceae bacterium]
MAAPLVGPTAPARAADLEPTDPRYTLRDARNIADAYGRITGPGGQLRNPAYLPALVEQTSRTSVAQLLEQVATPSRPSLTAGAFIPGWNVGNPLRASWDRTRGRMRPVQWTNRFGALVRGTLYAPLPAARDPYTGEVLRGPFPGVVITPGSVQGSEGMYRWLAQDLAERGYLVLTYDVQGQGTSETFPHQGQQINALPFCNPFAPPAAGELLGCPGVPFQQLANFTKGTRDALSFFLSTPRRPWRNPNSDDVAVDAFSPWHRLFDRSRDRRTDTPGRTRRVAIIGHSLGAAAVSRVQGVDNRVMTVVALDKLAAQAQGPLRPGRVEPVVPALSIQSEYGFTVTPWPLSGGSSLTPTPSPQGPDPRRERRTGWEAWNRAGVDSLVLVPRASTHLEFTDIPLVLPASRYGQALTSHYVQAWLRRYLQHERNDRALLGRRFTYLEPRNEGAWEPVALPRRRLTSYAYCSAYRLETPGGVRRDRDWTDVGCP